MAILHKYLVLCLSVPKHLSSSSFVHGITYILYIYIYSNFFCLLICPLIWHHTCPFSAKISSFAKRGVSQILRCSLVTELCITLWQPSTPACCHMPAERQSKVLAEMWVPNSVSLYRPLWGWVTWHKNGSPAAMEKWNKTVNQLFSFLSFMAKLPYSQLVMQQKCLLLRCL